MMFRDHISLFLEAIPLRIARLLRFFRIAEHRLIRALISSAEVELTLLSLFVLPEQTIVDVGANIGQHIPDYQPLVRSEQIIAFEPITPVYDQLIAAYPAIRAFNHALSSSKDVVDLRVPVIRSLPLFTRGSVAQFEEEGKVESFQMYRVATRRLDDCLTELSCSSVGLIKIDVEGHECEVMRGAIRTLENDRPVILMEIEQRHHQVPIHAILKEFEGYRYRGFFVDRSDITTLSPVARFSVEAHQQRNVPGAPYINNFLFLPEEHAERMFIRMSEYLSHAKPRMS